MAGPAAAIAKTGLLVLNDVTILWNGRTAFARTCWTWRRGEQWAVLGPNGSGKSLLALAICGNWPLAHGEIHYHFEADGDVAPPDTTPELSVALLSPQTQRELVAAESSFYQSRWHSGLGEGRRTVARFLSQASVEDRNPFEIGGRKGDPRRFRENRRRFSRWLGIESLFRRQLAALSNGEQRKVLLVHTLLRSPRLLILDDPFGGLDRDTRARLKTVIGRLTRAGMPVLLITHRPDELPRRTTHLLLVRNRRVVAQGAKRAMLKHPLARQLASLLSFPSRSSKRLTSNNRAAPLIELNHATVRLGNQRILDNITWTMRQGEHWALVGPNGSGKTTLLSLIQGDNPQAYALDLRLFGVRPNTTQTLWHLRRQIGWLSPELHLHYPVGWSCLEVVCSGFFNTVGLYEPGTSRQRAAARDWLRRLGLAGRAEQWFGELSLGDQRLVLLARAMVKKPKLLILDEPGQGLDAAHRHSLLVAVDNAVRQTGTSLIFVTHHAAEMPACITDVLELQSGRIRNRRKKRVAGRFRRGRLAS